MWLRLVYTLAYSGMFGCGCVEHRNDQYQDKENYEDSPSPTRHRAFIINVVGATNSVGGSLLDIQTLAEHSSLAVTQRYIEGDGAARVKVVELV